MFVKAAFRKQRNRYLAQLTEFLPWVLQRYACYKCPNPPAPPTQWRKALILGDNHVGDLLYRSGSLEPLKRGLPGCDFYYLAAPGSGEVLMSCPWLKAVLPLCESDWRLDLNAAALRKLREIDFDAAICSNPVHYPQDLKLALNLGIPSRAGYVFKGFSAWVTHPITIQYPKPFPAYFRDLGAQLTNQPPDWPLRPTVFATEEDDAVAEVLWQEFKFNAGQPVVACFMTSRQSHGVWPADSFARTFQILANQSGGQLLLCGARNDEPLLAQINRDYGLKAALNAGRIGLRPLVCLLRRCATVVSTDSGPRHLANAAGVPVVFVRNLLFNKIEAGAYCETEHDMAPDVECVPPGEQDELLRQTTPEMIAAKVLELLDQRPDPTSCH